MAELTMLRGDSFTYLVQIFYNSTTGKLLSQAQGLPTPAGFAPLNISGGKLWFTAKNNYADPDTRAVFQLSSNGGGIVFTSPNSGLATIQSTPDVTNTFPDSPTELHYDVQYRDANGVVTTTETGILIVKPDLTRTTTGTQPPPSPFTLPTGSVYPSGNFAGLALLDDADMQDDQLAFTQTHFAWWSLNKKGTGSAIPNVRQPAGSGKGVWDRLPWIHPRNLGVIPLYVDGTNGDDENDGLTAQTALRTTAERDRRTFGLPDTSEFGAAVFVYAEGCTPRGNVFASYDDAYRAWMAYQMVGFPSGAILVDDTFGSPVVRSGIRSYDWSRLAHLGAYAKVDGNPTVLTLQDGVQITKGIWRVGNSLKVLGQTTTQHFSPDALTGPSTFIDDRSSIFQAGTGNFASLVAGVSNKQWNVYLSGGSSVDGSGTGNLAAGTLVLVDDNGNLNVFAGSGCTIGPKTITGSDQANHNVLQSMSGSAIVQEQTAPYVSLGYDPVVLGSSSYNIAYSPGVSAGQKLDLLSNVANIAYAPATPGNWSPTPSDPASALDQLAARPSGGGSTNVFVYQQGGTASGNVYTSFATAYAAFVSSGQPYAVFVIDNSRGSPVVTGGPYDLSRIAFVAASSAQASVDLKFQNGVTVTNGILASNGVRLISVSSSPVYTLSGVQATVTYLENGAAILSEGGSDFVHATGFSSWACYLGSNCRLGTAGPSNGNALNADEGTNCNLLFAPGSTLDASCLAGAADAITAQVLVGSVIYSNSQPSCPGFAVVLMDDSYNHRYSAQNSNWNPGDVGDALDILANTITNQGPAASRPASPTTAPRVWFATDTGRVTWWDGSQWRDVGDGGNVFVFQPGGPSPSANVITTTLTDAVNAALAVPGPVVVACDPTYGACHLTTAEGNLDCRLRVSVVPAAYQMGNGFATNQIQLTIDDGASLVNPAGVGRGLSVYGNATSVPSIQFTAIGGSFQPPFPYFQLEGQLICGNTATAPVLMVDGSVIEQGQINILGGSIVKQGAQSPVVNTFAFLAVLAFDIDPNISNGVGSGGLNPDAFNDGNFSTFFWGDSSAPVMNGVGSYASLANASSTNYNDQNTAANHYLFQRGATNVQDMLDATKGPVAAGGGSIDRVQLLAFNLVSNGTALDVDSGYAMANVVGPVSLAVLKVEWGAYNPSDVAGGTGTIFVHKDGSGNLSIVQQNWTTPATSGTLAGTSLATAITGNSIHFVLTAGGSVGKWWARVEGTGG